MSEANELTAQAGAILDANRYMTLATADESEDQGLPVWTSDQVRPPAPEHVVPSLRDERIQASQDV
jgi:hypothetical protein